MSRTREHVMTSELQSELAQQAGPPRDLTMSRRTMAASVNQLVSQTAIDVLRRGGNAVDAAIAGAAMLMVVEPRNGHLGGDTFMLFHDARQDCVIALNGSGAAPARATLEHYREIGGIPEDGLLTCTVPGTVACWGHANERYGSVPLAELLAPAIAHADEGIPVTTRLHHMLTLDAPTYRTSPDSAAVFLPDGRVPSVGAIWRQPGLAASLRRVAEHGVDDFYRGELARELVDYSDRHSGLFTLDDLARHETQERPPLSMDYRGYTVHEQPPVSQGILVLLALNILAQFDLQQYGPGTAETLHLEIEALKLAFEDQAAYLGDPAFVDISVGHLLSEEHAREQASHIDLYSARSGLAPAPSHPDTTYMCTADESGSMVSYIHSLYAGAGVVMGDTGVLMNSRLQGFNLDEGHPDCLAPGKRPLHTLNNYVVHKDGKPILVGGTPGAHWQVQTNLQILVNILEFGMDVQQAVEAPRFTMGDQLSLGSQTVRIESRVGQDAADALTDRGQQVEVVGPWDAPGAVQLIMRDPETGIYRGATEVRRAGSTVLGF
ncbi:MAG TPA: gamma-glutamyltransferase [Thermomicrobiales bacterium]|nr:gamma-glutamyltransferase [Thermomicrobiales bacterium]